MGPMVNLVANHLRTLCHDLSLHRSDQQTLVRFLQPAHLTVHHEATSVHLVGALLTPGKMGFACFGDMLALLQG